MGTSRKSIGIGPARGSRRKNHCETRFQQRLSVLLHTHVCLITVCTLAALDAICVIGQLICDILIVREKLDHFELIDKSLTPLLLGHIVDIDPRTHEKWNLDAIFEVITGTDPHTSNGPIPFPPARNWTDYDYSNIGHRVRRAPKEKVPGHEVTHGALYDLTHAFHLGSMVILSVLLLETMLKVFAMGKKLQHHKLEVFDAIVVAISWSLDIAFWEGIWAHPGTKAATLLTYLLPWRVVRIVNSFVLVIQEKDHVRLKIVKQRLRQSLKKGKETLEKAAAYKHEVRALAGLCRKLGASDSEIGACSPSGRAIKRGSVHSALERVASLTFISSLSQTGSVPSLFDMGDTSSDDDDQGLQHKSLQKKVSQDLSAFSGTTIDSNSAVYSLEHDDHHGTGLENPGFQRDSRPSSSSSRSSQESAGESSKSSLERKNSDESEPPGYHTAVSKLDSNTRL
ncbi:voltage-gated hydrogen channel 1 [Plakobranchus ocellatus]|uniref:Voltage-gated hydrogen channel 1 n=1 Tax=Plakobranchus ocellatus TaxID=259542 RepID=A0AAV4BB67_9GAST|nr:voltage-gated hydrogen channel 1 [Plakobranchus ocellatus]